MILIKFKNRQEIFDKVCAHLLTQMKRSVDCRGLCVFRNSEGLKCAVGGIIPDEIYDSAFEHEDLITELIGERHLFSKKYIGLLRKLQEIHDLDEPENWERELEIYANIHRLKFNYSNENK